MIVNAPSIDKQRDMFSRMCLTRALEEELGRLHAQGRTRGPIHRCDGQEAVGVGVTAALEVEDKVTTTHRGHAVYLGKGMDPDAVVAEIMGRATGSCGGRAGHMLVADSALGMIGGNAIVGAGIPAATGMALSMQVLGAPHVAACVFGDGAAQTGICHESMNMASLWALPVIFVLEQNRFGLTVPFEMQSSVADLSVRATGYGMPAITVDGNDVVAVYRAVHEMAARARRGDGPGLIVAETYRLEGFSTSDMGGYQDEEEVARWKERDPLAVSRGALMGAGVPELEIDSLWQAAQDRIAASFAAAEQAPLPEFDVDRAANPYAVRKV